MRCRRTLLRGLLDGASDMPKDQDVLDIVRDVSRELRFNPSFCVMLHKLDEDEAQ
jgi:hypothetical protein